MKAKAPLPLFIILSVAILGVATAGIFTFNIAQRFENPNLPKIDFNRAKAEASTQASNLRHLLSDKRKRVYFVANEFTFPCQPECPAPFSVNPRPDSSLFTL